MEDMLYDDDLDILDIINDGFPRRWNERANYFETMDNLGFFGRFRLTKPTVAGILEEAEHRLSYNNRVNNPVSPINQLLLTLRYYASNGHQIGIGDFMWCSQNTASRIINKVSRAIADLRSIYVKSPETGIEKLNTQEQFYRIARFPRVTGVIDCTHIRIQLPGGADAEVFRNRKNYFSINTQLVGNANLENIFNNSRILARYENGEFGEGLLLGDSGYGLRSFLLTPLLNPQTRGEQLYNEAHIRTRNTIERSNGFPVLAYGMRCHINNVFPIRVATAVLHNKARRMGEDVPSPPEGIDENILEYLIEQGNIPVMPEENNNRLAINHRQLIIEQFFNNLPVV